MRRLLVSGASGFLGHHLLQQLRSIPGYRVSGTYYTHRLQDDKAQGGAAVHWYRADLGDEEQLAAVFQQARPDVVVHLAAISSVEEGAQSLQQVSEVNVGGTERMARLCTRYKAWLVFLSTDYVFAGDRGRYREDEPPAPVVHYGRTKWQAEQAVASQLAHWSILRTSLVYGWPPPHGHGNLVMTIRRCLENGQPFYGHTDMYRTPTYVGDVVGGILRLMEGDYVGIYHVAGADWVNMYEFALMVAEVFQLDSQLVRPALASIQDAKTVRPNLLGLDSTWTARCLDVRLSGAIAGLQQMCDERRNLP